MKAKVKQRDVDVPARREADFVSDSTYAGGGYFEFTTDSSGSGFTRKSLTYVRTKDNYQITKEVKEDG